MSFYDTKADVLHLTVVLDRALDVFIAAYGTTLGNIQLLDVSDSHRILAIAAQRGFAPSFLETFARVSAEDESACGRALRRGQTIVIPDVDVDPDYAPFRGAAREAGYRAVLSTPLVSTWGHTVGVISTHFAAAGAPPPDRIVAGEEIARRTAHEILRAMSPSS